MVSKRPQNNENVSNGQSVTYVKDVLSSMQSSNRGKVIATTTAQTNVLKKRVLGEKTNSNAQFEDKEVCSFPSDPFQLIQSSFLPAWMVLILIHTFSFIELPPLHDLSICVIFF
jgi:hypothetical protein